MGGILYIQSVEVEVYDIDDLEDIDKKYRELQKSSYESSLRYINAMNGSKTIIGLIKKELETHQLQTRIAKTTGNTVMIAGAVGAIFSFGISAIVAGAVGGAISVGTDIADWVVTSKQSNKIKQATTDLKEYQFDFVETYTAFQNFTTSMSKKMGVDIGTFMGVMSNIKRLGSDAYKAYSTFKGFQATHAMFEALKSGKSIEHVGTAFSNAADMSMLVNRVGINLGKEVSTFTKVGVWFGENTSKVSSF